MSRRIKFGGNRPQGPLQPFGDEAARFGPLHDNTPSSYQDWLSVYFISRGHYVITDLALDRYGGNGASRAERRANAGIILGEMVGRGDGEKLYREGMVARRAHLDWQDPEARKAVVKKLIESLNKPPESLDFDDMRLNGLSGLMNRYKSSPYFALVEAGFAHPKTDVIEHSRLGVFDKSKLYPWQLARAGNGLYRDPEIRVAAVKWLHSVCGKEAMLITCDDFSRNGLVGLLGQRYSGSPHRALAEAGLAYSSAEALAHAAAGGFKEDKPYPWHMDNARIYHEPAMRSAATKWLLWRLGKPPSELTQADFLRNGLSGLMQFPPYKSSPYAALVESGHAYTVKVAISHAAKKLFGEECIYPWEMNNIRIYSDKSMRVGAVRWLVWRSGKDARDLTVEDFTEAGLHGLLANHYDGSPFKALCEAGEVGAWDEGYMRRRGAGRFA